MKGCPEGQLFWLWVVELLVIGLLSYGLLSYWVVELLVIASIRVCVIPM